MYTRIPEALQKGYTLVSYTRLGEYFHKDQHTVFAFSTLALAQEFINTYSDQNNIFTLGHSSSWGDVLVTFMY